jgi:hypothetical protein
MSLKEFIENLTEDDLKIIQEEFDKKNSSVKQYSFSRISISQLRELFEIEKNYDNSIFDNWLQNKIILNQDTENFLKKLLEEEAIILKDYNEEDLKMYFLSQIFNHIKFKDMKNKIRFFSEENLIYKTDKFILNGTPDFIIAKGLDRPQQPYFFIQEFKKEKGTSDPEYQLLAELISAIELNNWNIIKGCYIKGIHWYFVILKRLEKHKYEYFVSQSFDSTKINDLKDIYKNLVFIKNEIIEKVKMDKVN